VKKLLSGNEAIARGAYESGVHVAAAYPGTPSTEVLENIARYPEIYAEWAPNEKVALDVAIGAAYAGRRALAALKHVGLNVAADSLFYVSHTGTEGALVIVCADDPGMHSSQNEQDNRRYAKFAQVPCIEPSDSQEAKDLVGVALEMSLRFDTPVILRVTTRISHSDGVVELGERIPADGDQARDYERNPRKYVMIPGHARLRHPVILERTRALSEFAETFPHNRVEMGNPALGIVSAGVAYQYAREVFPGASFLKLGMTYPLPPRLIADFASQVDQLIIVEELDPFLEEEFCLMGIEARGKEIFPITGELDAQVVADSARAAGLLPPTKEIAREEPGPLPPRPPVLCPGCTHRGVFHVTKKLNLVVNGDIGCYTLSCLPPLEALHTCGCMGASIGVAHGVDKAGVEEGSVGVIGDSTFFHSGLHPLVNMAYNHGKSTVIILDNSTTAMTGHQDHPGTGRTLKGEEGPAIELEPLVRALGISDVHTVDPYDLAQVEEVLRASIATDEPSVIIARRPCALLIRNEWRPLRVLEDICNGCGLCFQVGCPAIVQSSVMDAKTGRPKAMIDAVLCTGCEICAQVCTRKAILFRDQLEDEKGELE